MQLRRILVTIGLACALVACKGKDEPKSTRWDKPAASAAAKTPKAKPTVDKSKVAAGGQLNKFFPPDNTDGYKRVFTQEKTGFAEAKLSKGGKEVAKLSINDVKNNTSASKKFEKSKEKVKGYPLTTVGKKQSALLVANRWQVKVSSGDLDEGARKKILEKFDLAGLAAMK